jgi:hypothetical protein
VDVMSQKNLASFMLTGQPKNMMSLAIASFSLMIQIKLHNLR